MTAPASAPASAPVNTPVDAPVNTPVDAPAGAPARPPAAAAPVRKTAAERRREIVQAALDLACEHGPENVSTGMIAEHLGLTQPAIYKHFRHKEDIWAAAAEGLAEKVRENIATAGQGDRDPVARLRALVLAHLDLIGRNPALPELMTMRAAPPARSSFRATIRGVMLELREAFERAIAQGVASGALRRDLEPADAAQLLLGLIQSLALRVLVSRDRGVFRRDGARLLELLLSCFSASGEKT